MEKAGRNDPCPCGSGKKFKKCCESKVLKRSIGPAQVLTGANSLSSFFQRKVIPVNPASNSISKESLEREVPPEDKKADL